MKDQAKLCQKPCDEDFSECRVKNGCAEDVTNIDCLRECTAVYDECTMHCPCKIGGECEAGCPCPNFECATLVPETTTSPDLGDGGSACSILLNVILAVFAFLLVE